MRRGWIPSNRPVVAGNDRSHDSRTVGFLVLQRGYTFSSCRVRGQAIAQPATRAQPGRHTFPAMDVGQDRYRAFGSCCGWLLLRVVSSRAHPASSDFLAFFFASRFALASATNLATFSFCSAVNTASTS